MCIINFFQKLLRKPNQNVLGFYNRIQAYPKRNLSCRSEQVDDTKQGECPLQGNRNVSEHQIKVTVVMTPSLTERIMKKWFFIAKWFG